MMEELTERQQILFANRTVLTMLFDLLDMCRNESVISYFERKNKKEKPIITQIKMDDPLKEKKILIIKQALDHYSSIDPLFFQEKQVFEMYYLDGLKIKDISRQTRIPTTNIHNFLKYAEMMVKNYIKKHYIIINDINDLRDYI